MPNVKSSIEKLILISFFSMFIVGISFAADATAPVTTATKDPSSPNGNNDWYTTPVIVTLSSTDLDSGVKEINYKIDSGNWHNVDFSNTLNLAPNPSFETSSFNPPLNVDSWGVGTVDNYVNYSSDNTTYKSGFENTSIKIDSSGGSWHSINNAANFAAASLYNNMNAYAWIKTNGVLGTAYFKIYAISQDGLGNQTITPITQSATLTGTNDWTQVSVNFIVNVENVIGVYMDIGLDGAGTIWIDAVNINQSVTPSTSFTVATDSALHTISYYAVDRSDNVEQTKTLTFKIDQTAPGNWSDSGAVRALSGNDHELYLWTHVDDNTSGLSPFTDKFQYTTRKYDGFGKFSNLASCNSTWISNGWANIVTLIPYPGVHSAYMLTPKVDFCDSTWKICKYVRFYAEDMAGNNVSKDICINGPWIKVRGNGIVGTKSYIDMISEADDFNTDGLIETGGESANFFDSSIHWYLRNAPTPILYDYGRLYSIVTGSKNTISTTGNLVAGSGVYVINGNYEITNSKTPNNYSTASFNQVVFVNGDLKISYNVKVAAGSTALFVVKGKVEIAKSVTDVEIGIVSDGNFYTAYNITEGEESSTLILKGIYSANRFYFQRTLQGTQNEHSPSEDFTYEPKYIVKLGGNLGVNAVKWISSD